MLKFLDNYKYLLQNLIEFFLHSFENINIFTVVIYSNILFNLSVLFNTKK